MSTLLDTLASYVPAHVVRHYNAPDTSLSPATDRLEAALLFADISGFTALTEQLAHRPAGVEELTRILNTSFSQILDLIAAHGGDVVKFAGDALLALWPADDDGLAAATLRAAQCALGIHTRIANFYRLIAGAPLSLRIGVAAGELTAFHIGGVYGRWEFLVAGEPLLQVAAAEHVARPGETVLAPSAWALVQTQCHGISLPTNARDRPDDACVQLERIHTSVLPRPAHVAPLALRMDAFLRGYIPGAVMSRLIAEQTAWLAELRRVTVLFINLPDLGYTTSLEQAQTIMQTLQTALYRYEGSVNKLSLDDKGVTLVAAFGLPPFAHEDDPARGVQAALSIHQVLHALGLRCAIGVTTGRAFCGEIGSDHRREYTLIGDVVNLAARLMQAVPAARTHAHDVPITLPILCDATTAGASSRTRLNFEPLPPIMVKGKAEPIFVFRPRVNLSLPTPNSPSRGAAVIGRAAERTQLTEHLHALLRGGEGGAMLIEGEAGMGKSRLADYLRQLTETLHGHVLTGAADATEQATPYYAWRAIFAQLLTIDPLGSLVEQRERVFHLLDADPELALLAPLLNAVLPLGLPETAQTEMLTGQMRAEATRDLLVRLLQGMVNRAPSLLIVEDAHWLDSASWSLILTVNQRVRPLLLLLTMRPLTSSGVQWGHIQPHATEYAALRAAARLRLHLESLSADESEALVCQRLGVTALPTAVAALIREKAQGNPFFCEELAYALRDTGLIPHR